LHAIPAQAGIEVFPLVSWIPVFTGMTISMPKDSHTHDRLTKESIIEKTHLTDSHPPPNLPLEGGGK